MKSGILMKLSSFFILSMEKRTHNPDEYFLFILLKCQKNGVYHIFDTYFVQSYTFSALETSFYFIFL